MFSVTLSDVNLRYRDHVLFQNLALHLPSGSCTCLLGPSGVGKSSLLHLLADLPPDDETLASKKIQTSDGLPLTGRVALMAQQDNLLPWLSVLDNALLGYRLRNDVNPERLAEARALLSDVGFNARDCAKKVTALSGGMRQRVALVRTLLEDKALVLMDEPFSALDSLTRFQLQSLSARLLKAKTVLLITHDPLEALRLGDHIYILQGSPAVLVPYQVPMVATPRDFNEALVKDQVALWQALAATGSTL